MWLGIYDIILTRYGGTDIILIQQTHTILFIFWYMEYEIKNVWNHSRK